VTYLKLFILFCLVNLSLYSNAQFDEKEVEFLERVFTNRGPKVFLKDFLPYLSAKERMTFKKISVNFDNGSTVHSCTKKDSFYITIGRQFIFHVVNTGLMHEFAAFGDSSRNMLVKLYVKFRAEIFIADPVEYLGLIPASDSLNLNRNRQRNRMSFFPAFFIYLHEIGHVMTSTIGHCNKLSNGGGEIDSDNWAINLITRYYVGTKGVPPTGYILDAFDFSHFQNDATSKLSSKYISEYKRKENVLSILRNAYCAKSDTSKYCKDLEAHLFNLQVDTFELYRKDFSVNQYDKFISQISLAFDSIYQTVQPVVQKSIDNDYNLDLKFTVDSLLWQIAFKTEITAPSYTAYDKLAEAYLVGNWFMPKDTVKALQIYEILSHIGTSSPYRMLNYDRAFTAVYVHLENYNLITAILCQYKFNQYDKAIYYYSRAKEFCRQLPKEFYENKIDFIKFSQLYMKSTK
jgi:hypothetical protein